MEKRTPTVWNVIYSSMIRFGEQEKLAHDLFAEKAYESVEAARAGVAMAAKVISEEGLLPDELVASWLLAADLAKKDQELRIARYGYHQRVFEMGNLQLESERLARKILTLRMRLTGIREEAARAKAVVDSTAFENVADIPQCGNLLSLVHGLEIFEKMMIAGIPPIERRLEEIEARLAALKNT